MKIKQSAWMSLEGLQDQGQTTESLSGLSSWHFQVVWWHSSQRSFQTNLSLLSWFKNGVKLFWKSLRNFTSQTNRPARSLRINCTSTDLPLFCMLPRIPLKHQIVWAGPQSMTQSFTEMAVKVHIWCHRLSTKQLFKTLTKFDKKQISFKIVSLG